MQLNIEITSDHHLLAGLNETVQSLHCQLYPQEFKPYERDSIATAFAAMLSEPGAHAFVAKDGEQAIGYVLCFVQKRNENAFQYAKTVLCLDQLAVDPQYRNKGVGNHLLERVLELAGELDIEEVHLDHWDENTDAGQFFSSKGFQYFKYKMKRMAKVNREGE